MLPYDKRLKPNSRHLRSNMTDAEQKLWAHVRRKQILSVPFYRQKPIGRYIVDFYALQAALVIELDGGQHFEAEQQAYDAQRSDYLQQQGLLVLRFSNLDVLQNTTAVLEQIWAVVEQRL